MQCSSPPGLDDQTLLAYLDGQAPESVAAHVEQCAYCRERAARLSREQKGLAALLYRNECPSPLELGEYHLGVLPATRAAAIEQHLPHCPHCRREIAQLEEYLASLEPAAQPDSLQKAVERARVWVARLVRGGSLGGQMGPLGLAPAYAGLRGEASEEPLVYQAENAQVIVDVKPDAERADRWAVLGLTVGLEETSAFEAQLWQDNNPLQTAQLDELGNFVLSGLDPGTYTLLLIGPDLQIQIEPLPVGHVEREQ